MNLVLAGNPNVGKTTFFNAVTGKKAHTGNWNGKTVLVSQEYYEYNNKLYKIADLPGTYSLEKNSIEEEVAINYLQNNNEDLAIVFIDGTNLSRGLFLYFELLRYKKNAVLIITMNDILEKNNIIIDVNKLENIIGTKVLLLDLKKIKDVEKILDEINSYKIKTNNIVYENDNYENRVINLHKMCDRIYKSVVNKPFYTDKTTQKIDELILNKKTGIPIATIFVLFIFWLSIYFSNILQGVLYDIFNNIMIILYSIFATLNTPDYITTLLLDGGISTALFVGSVMIPPMMIFFPLFSIIEDIGLIPRISFNLDGFFSKFYCNGKNSISMLLGFGCNCVGITSTRIFENEKSRKVAILTNNFIPCNGRLPMIILIISTFLSTNIFSSTLILICFIIFSVFISLLVAFCFNIYYKNTDNNFVYELPIYKKPTLKLSVFNRAFYVLGKALTFSCLAGILIVALKNTYLNGENMLTNISYFLNPLGVLMGLSGVILLAFIIGISANEIVFPIVFMLYSNQSLFLSGDISISETMYNNGFTSVSAVCMILFSLIHFPCIASLSTIKKETDSTRFTILCAIVPLIIGVFLCICTNFILS